MVTLTRAYEDAQGNLCVVIICWTMSCRGFVMPAFGLFMPLDNTNCCKLEYVEICQVTQNNVDEKFID